MTRAEEAEIFERFIAECEALRTKFPETPFHEIYITNLRWLSIRDARYMMNKFWDCRYNYGDRFGYRQISKNERILQVCLRAALRSILYEETECAQAEELRTRILRHYGRQDIRARQESVRA